MTEYTSSIKRFCSVYKSEKKQEMYLYIDRKAEFNSLPEGLLSLFGKPEHVLDLILTPEKSLARVDATKVLNEIQANGFYLQMPPGTDDDILDLHPAPKDSLNG